jgi:formylglycine-generating enzyme required for sulfatase activity
LRRTKGNIASLAPYAFISFASTDAELAHRAVEALERGGIRCWISDRDIQLATSYPAAITGGIKGSGALLLLLTEDSNQSRHVLREVELAFNARRPILPVCIAGTKPSSDLQYFLSTSQWLDAGRSFDDADLAKIAPVLAELLERGSSRKAGGSGSRRWLWTAASVALVAMAATVAMLWFRGARSPSSSPTAADPSRPTTTSVPPTVTPPASSSPVGTPQPAKPDSATPAGAATAPTAKPTAGRTTRINPRDGQTYVWIVPGSFEMGCSAGDSACDADEKPVHAVDIPRGFWLARTEVTVAQFRNASTGRTSADGAAGDVPVTRVDWAEAKAYCTRIGGRLPTEAEWEYAARAGTRGRYYGPLNTIAWFADNSDERPHSVAAKTPNAFGLYDMLGNVSEWVLDRYYNAYDDTSDPLAPEQPLAGNASGVARGGAWTSEAAGARLSRRLEMPPDGQEPHIGFRCAVDRLP